MTIQEREKIVQTFLNELEFIGGRFNTSVEKYILQGGLNDDELALLFGQIDFFNEINALGLSDSIAKFMAEHEKVLEEVLLKARERNLDITAIDLQYLDYVMRADENAILGSARMYAEQFRSAILKPLISGVPRKQIVAELLPVINQSLPFKPNWLETAVDQAFTAFSNVATQEAFSDAPETKWILVHPLDRSTRRLCKHAINIQKDNPQGFTIEEINNGALNKGFVTTYKSEPSIYTWENLGGYKCRGIWVLADEQPKDLTPNIPKPTRGAG